MSWRCAARVWAVAAAVSWSVPTSAPALTLSIQAPATVEVGVPFTVELFVQGAPELADDYGPPSVRAFDLDLAYDDSRLQYEATVFAELLGSPGFQSIVFDSAAGGVLDLKQVSLLNSYTLDWLQPQDFLLASVSFQAIASPDTTWLELVQRDISDVSGARLAVGGTSAASIAIVPEPVTGLLLAGGLLALAALRRGRRPALLALLLASSYPGPAGAAPITTFASAFQFRWHIGPNSVGLPAGDRQFVGILDVAPTAGTAVVATQGAVTRPLPFTPFTVFPTMFRSLEPFDPALTGAWSISAANGADAVEPVLTPAIANPELLPFVENLEILGSGPTPLLTWSLPDITGLGASFLRVRAYDDLVDDVILNTVLPLGTTAFAIPGGLLAPGIPYVFSINLHDSDGNVSTAFTQSPYLVPEPGTAALLGVGLLGLALGRASGRRMARAETSSRKPCRVDTSEPRSSDSSFSS